MANSERRAFGNVRKLKSGRYQARYIGPEGMQHVAPNTFSTKTEASRFLARVQADIERGAWLNPALGSVTFGQWADHYMSDTELRANTRARYQSVLKVHLLPAFGNAPLSSITPIQVKALVDRWKANLKPATTWTNWRVLVAIINAAVESDVLVKSPCRPKLMKLPDVEKKERRTLTMSELKQLADAVPTEHAPLIWLGGVVGLRWQEASALRVKSIDFLRGRLTVDATIEEIHGEPVRLVEATKSEASHRTIAVPSFVLDVLAKHMAERGLTADNPETLLFTTKRHGRGKGGAVVGGGPLRATNFRNRVLNPAVKSLGFDGLDFHGLRSVAASLMIDNDEHPRVGQHRLGHASPDLFMERYSRVSDAKDKEAAQRLEDLWQAAQGDQPLGLAQVSE